MSDKMDFTLAGLPPLKELEAQNKDGCCFCNPSANGNTLCRDCERAIAGGHTQLITMEAELGAKQYGDNFNSSGSKYLRTIRCSVDGKVDVYAVIDAFGVTCPATQHALKKLLCAGIRGKGDTLQDLNEARDAVARAVQMETARQSA